MNVTRDSIVLAWTPGRSSRPAAFQKSDPGGDLDDDDYTLESAAKDGKRNDLEGLEVPEAEFIGRATNTVDAAATSQAINSPVGYIVQYRSEKTGKHQVQWKAIRELNTLLNFDGIY